MNNNKLEKIKLTRKEALESALINLIMEQPFYGTLLQQINISYNELYPTAALTYDKKKDLFSMNLNYEFFASRPIIERKAVLFHEILHFTHQHLWRFMTLVGTKEITEIKKEEQFLFNIAADMAINQYITPIFEGWVDVDKFKQKNGTAFPLYRSMEEYHKLLKDNDGSDAKKKAEEKKGKGDPNSSEFKGETPNEGELDKYRNSKEVDIHDWDDLNEDEKQKMMEEAKKLIERTIEKTSYSMDQLPGHIKDLMKELETQISGINYKRILKETIKRTISCSDRDNTWNRPSKRFGTFAPGTKSGKIPNLIFLCDTSGSISYTEMNEFLKTVDGFLKLGQKTCRLGLWHTNLYKTLKYKNASSLVQSDIEAGGTDVTEALDYAMKKGADLVVVLTDGYINRPNKTKYPENLLWVISKNGTISHPYAKYGKTIQIK